MAEHILMTGSCENHEVEVASVPGAQLPYRVTYAFDSYERYSWHEDPQEAAKAAVAWLSQYYPIG